MGPAPMSPAYYGSFRSSASTAPGFSAVRKFSQATAVPSARARAPSDVRRASRSVFEKGCVIGVGSLMSILEVETDGHPTDHRQRVRIDTYEVASAVRVHLGVHAIVVAPDREVASGQHEAA